MSTKELLGEYSKLASRLQHINDTLQEMNAVEVTQLIDKIRIVERKMGLVYTLFKSSVYTINAQARESDQGRAYDQDQPDHQEQLEQQDGEGHNTSFTPDYHESEQGQQQQQQRRRLSNQSQYQQQEYDDQTYPQQSYQQQQHDQSSRRQSLYSSGEGNNQFNRSTNRLSRVSNARDDYQAATGKLSIVALSRERASARWNHGGDSEPQTNRPRFH